MEDEYFEETGREAYNKADMCYSDEYVEWLENQLKQ